eukprot:1150431-Pelagomonas_calceolata.AAC.6
MLAAVCGAIFGHAAVRWVLQCALPGAACASAGHVQRTGARNMGPSMPHTMRDVACVNALLCQ